MIPPWLVHFVDILAIAVCICALCLVIFDPIIRKITKHISTNHNRSTIKEGKRLYIEPIAPIKVSYPGGGIEPQISSEELQRVECAIAKALRWPRIYFKSGIILNNYKDDQFTFSSKESHANWIVAEAFIPVEEVSVSENQQNQQSIEPEGKVYFLEPEEEIVELKKGMALVISAGKENLRRTVIQKNIMALYFAAGGNFVPWVLNLPNSSNNRNVSGLTPTRMISVNPQTL